MLSYQIYLCFNNDKDVYDINREVRHKVLCEPINIDYGVFFLYRKEFFVAYKAGIWFCYLEFYYICSFVCYIQKQIIIESKVPYVKHILFVVMEIFRFVFIITNLACFVNGFYPRQPPHWKTKTHFDITNTGSLQAIAHYIYQSKNTNASSPSSALDEFFSSGKLNYILSLICGLYSLTLTEKWAVVFHSLLTFSPKKKCYWSLFYVLWKTLCSYTLKQNIWL